MGRKCGVQGCLSESSRTEDTGVTFHKVPRHSDIRPKWMSLCKISEDKKNTKVIYICSRHFLRADFCNFKGKKYMLRQGVLPSVFPWDKSKLEAIKNVTSPNPDNADLSLVKVESELEEPVNENETSPLKNIKGVDLKQEESVKVEDSAQDQSTETPTDKTKTRKNNFTVNSRIEALSLNNAWYPAKVLEEDYTENEVLIHFEQFSTKFDEWICVDSPRLRPLQASNASSSGKKKRAVAEIYNVGDRCLASWSDARKFPATVTKVISSGN